jgi:uncharacterized membrane protein YbhN (UPF0104 family)
MLDAVAKWPVPFMRRIHTVFSNILGGVREAAVRPGTLGKVLIITLIEWGFLAAAMLVGAAAIGLALPLPQLLGVLIANFIAFAVPTSSSGSVGIYELAGTATLVLLFDMPRETALGLVLVLHFVMTVSGVAGGLAGLHLAHVSLAEIRDRTRAEPGGAQEQEQADG